MLNMQTNNRIHSAVGRHAQKRVQPAAKGVGRPQLKQAQHEFLPSEGGGVASSISELSKLDHQLVVAVETGLIRFVRIEWLLAQPDGYRLENRQELERREEQGESPLLKCSEAGALLKRADRSMGVTSHGWLSPHHVSMANHRTGPLHIDWPKRPLHSDLAISPASRSRTLQARASLFFGAHSISQTLSTSWVCSSTSARSTRCHVIRNRATNSYAIEPRTLDPSVCKPVR